MFLLDADDIDTSMTFDSQAFQPLGDATFDGNTFWHYSWERCSVDTTKYYIVRAQFFDPTFEGGEASGLALTFPCWFSTGDVDVSGVITAGDIVRLVNYVFKGGAAPQPCNAAGDVNCSGTVTSADIIALVNFVFKSGVRPCDGCASPLAASCP
jgi:hypothetical protein